MATCTCLQNGCGPSGVGKACRGLGSRRMQNVRCPLSPLFPRIVFLEHLFLFVTEEKIFRL